MEATLDSVAAAAPPPSIAEMPADTEKNEKQEEEEDETLPLALPAYIEAELAAIVERERLSHLERENKFLRESIRVENADIRASFKDLEEQAAKLKCEVAILQAQCRYMAAELTKAVPPPAPVVPTPPSDKA